MLSLSLRNYSSLRVKYSESIYSNSNKYSRSLEHCKAGCAQQACFGKFRGRWGRQGRAAAERTAHSLSRRPSHPGTALLAFLPQNRNPVLFPLTLSPTCSLFLTTICSIFRLRPSFILLFGHVTHNALPDVRLEGGSSHTPADCKLGSDFVLH